MRAVRQEHATKTAAFSREMKSSADRIVAAIRAFKITGGEREGGREYLVVDRARTMQPHSKREYISQYDLSDAYNTIPSISNIYFIVYILVQ